MYCHIECWHWSFDRARIVKVSWGRGEGPGVWLVLVLGEICIHWRNGRCCSGGMLPWMLVPTKVGGGSWLVVRMMVTCWCSALGIWGRSWHCCDLNSLASSCLVCAAYLYGCMLRGWFVGRLLLAHCPGCHRWSHSKCLAVHFMAQKLPRRFFAESEVVYYGDCFMGEAEHECLDLWSAGFRKAR